MSASANSRTQPTPSSQASSTTDGSRLTTSSLGSRKTDIKPSDVYELRLQTQQMALRARRLRTHQMRVEGRILANTNAINKTLEQQSDEPSVVTNHTNTIPQLKRSLDGAENTLAALREEIETIREHDKTYVVKEFEEEVKIVYSEYQRLCREQQEAHAQAARTAAKLAEAEGRVSPQRLAELRKEVRDLREQNATLRDKAVAYYTKREKLLAEYTIKENEDKKVPNQKALQEITDKQEEVKGQIEQEVQAFEEAKAEHRQKIVELRQILEDQKKKFQDFLVETEPEPEPTPEDAL
jgi:chromosome segregation ATPase